ncbi:MAG: nucleotidyltransferase domain-containing protein [Defluviitaleaceae bacterium]|nr:nucleotidyltransferase domain-containing protein [Defluviitaleaceae bacterium]
MSQEKIIEIITPILRQYNVAKAALFGSYARGEQHDNSDIDLIIDLSYEHCLGLYDIYDEIEDALNRKVDIVTMFSLSNAISGDKFFDNIKDDLRWFYEA